jgi:hypothetical protein
MAKKRKTRREKIITQLRRELKRQKQKTLVSSTKSKVSQGAIPKKPKIEPSKPKQPKKADNSIFFYDPRLVRKDLAKTLTLATVAISLEVMLYLYLR